MYKIKDIIGEQYREFIPYALEKSDFFIPVKRTDKSCNNTIGELKEELKP
jgi:hypothetical protein